MKLKQIATWLNTIVVPNSEGASVTVAEDLSNIADYGKLIANLTGDEFLDFQKRLAVGISKNVWDMSTYNHKDYGIFKDTIEYGGALQRIMASDFYDATNTSIVNLIDGVNYFDGTYHGDNLQSKVFEQTESFAFVYSLSDVENQKQRFTTIEGVTSYFAEVENNAKNSIEYYIECMQKRQLIATMTDVLSNSKEVKLITAYNNEFGTSYATIEDIKSAGTDTIRSFFAFCRGVIKRVVAGMKEPSKRYNNGTVLTWTSEDRLRGVMLAQFDTDTEYLALSGIYNSDKVADVVGFKTVDAWQNCGANALDNYGTSAEIVVTDGTTPATYSNVVAMVYDSDCMGIMPTLNKVTTQYIGGTGDFTNYTHNYVIKSYNDARLNRVVFTLE